MEKKSRRVRWPGQTGRRRFPASVPDIRARAFRIKPAQTARQATETDRRKRTTSGAFPAEERGRTAVLPKRAGPGRKTGCAAAAEGALGPHGGFFWFLRRTGKTDRGSEEAKARARLSATRRWRKLPTTVSRGLAGSSARLNRRRAFPAAAGATCGTVRRYPAFRTAGSARAAWQMTCAIGAKGTNTWSKAGALRQQRAGGTASASNARSLHSQRRTAGGANSRHRIRQSLTGNKNSHPAVIRRTVRGARALRKRDRTTASDAAGIGEVKRVRRPICAESARADDGGELIPAPQRRTPKPPVSSGAVQGPKA